MEKLNELYKEKFKDVQSLHACKSEAYKQRSKIFYESMREYMVLKRLES